MQFTSQIITLAIGFGVGYALLIISNSQEEPLKNVGKYLGLILIVMSIILALFSCYYSMKIGNRDYMQSGCPVQRMMQQQSGPAANTQTGVNGQAGEDVQDNNDNNSNIKPNTDTENSSDLPDNENVPASRTKDDHE